MVNFRRFIIDNRQNILLCALKLFASKGYDGVGVQEIVDNAGITKPTLYHYFGNKKGLLQSLINEFTAHFYLCLNEACKYEKRDIKTTLENICQSYFSFCNSNKEFYRMFLAMYYSPPESEQSQIIMEVNKKFFDKIEHVFLEAGKDHGNMKNRHTIYAFSFIGIINTYISLSLNDYLELNQDCVNKSVKQFMHGIFS